MSEQRGCIEHTAYASGCDGCAEVDMVAAQTRDYAALITKHDALRSALEATQIVQACPAECRCER